MEAKGLQVTSNRGNWAGEKTRGGRWSEPLTSMGKGDLKKTTTKKKTILIQQIFWNVAMQNTAPPSC